MKIYLKQILFFVVFTLCVTLLKGNNYISNPTSLFITSKTGIGFTPSDNDGDGMFLAIYGLGVSSHASKFLNLRAEFNIVNSCGWKSPERLDGDIKFTSTIYLTNIFLDFYRDKIIRPYAGLGYGYGPNKCYFVKWGGENSGKIIPLKTIQSSMVQLSTGMSFTITEKLIGDLGINIVEFDSSGWSEELGEVSLSNGQVHFLFSLRYTLF